jgi:uncharacterized protein (DUF362 family)
MTKAKPVNRRTFLQYSMALAAGAPILLREAQTQLLARDDSPSPGKAASLGPRSDAKVAIVPCRSYGPEVRTALDRSFDLIGGIGGLVKNRTVTVKVNLTGTDFSPYLGRPVGETYMTHYATALALVSSLFAAGARRVRLVESTQSRSDLRGTLSLGDWDVNALEALGKVEFENTRNLGAGKSYSHLRVPTGGYVFSALDLNRAYEDTDVMISLAKLKNHITAGVTLSMKNLFGITPNSLYGDEAGSEDAQAGRGVLHDPSSASRKIDLPGLKQGITSNDPTWRVPRITVDACAARPIHLAIIDGIMSMTGGEGRWCSEAATIKPIAPGVLIVGSNPVSTDAVATSIMGYDDPRALRGTKPFAICDNHLLLAEQAGLGTARLDQIDVRGLALAKARCPYG